MNKFFLKLVFTYLIFLNFSVANATQASMTSDFNTALNIVVGNSNNLETTTIEGYSAWRFLYNDSNVQFSNFGTTVNYFPYIGLAPQTEVNAFGYQCVGFVKATTNLAGRNTTTWNASGGLVTTNNLPVRGDVIATFTNGTYDSSHTAVVLSSTPIYINVIDQNWEGNGRVVIHAIVLGGAGSRMHDARNYSIVGFYLSK